MSEMQVTLRVYYPKTDEPFVYATWLNNQWYAIPKKDRPNKCRWFKDKCSQISNILSISDTLVSCLKSDPYVILGYIVINEGHLEWLYIKEDFRRCGVETLLISQLKEKKDGTEQNRIQ